MFSAYAPPECKKAREFHGLFYILAEKEGHSPATSQGTDLHTN